MPIESPEIAELRRQAEEEEAAAETALSPEETLRVELTERRERARGKRLEALAGLRRATLSEQEKLAREASRGGYAVGAIDPEEESPGAGCYVIRSPIKDDWKKFKDQIENASGSGKAAKIDAAYRTMAAKCIVWGSVDVDAQILDLFDRYPLLAQAIGDAAGRLGGAVAAQRKS